MSRYATKTVTQLTSSSWRAFIARASPTLPHSVTTNFQRHVAIDGFLTTVVGDFCPALCCSHIWNYTITKSMRAL